MPQAVHEAPSSPHSSFAVPDWQLPPLQHPPLHTVVFALHEFPHVWVVVLQACPEAVPLAAGQSSALPQPHCPFTQPEPFEFPVQLVHVPEVPHAGPMSPAEHVPLLQHPPLHALSFAAPHALPHWFVVLLHAWPAVLP